MRSRENRSAAAPGEGAPDADRRSRRLSAIVGAALAAAVSIGLVYWISAGGDRTLSGQGRAPPSAPAPRAYAPPKPDGEQVIRAYEQLQEIYADQGASGVVTFARACAGALRADPGVLDFCLAFDIYAASLESDDEVARAWQAQAAPRDLALAQSVLPPGTDAAARLSQVRALARQASLETAPNVASAPPARPAEAPANPAVSGSAPARAASAKSASAAAVAACRRRATAAQRTVCASPALREADRRLRLAYRRALAAGASPRRLARDQARFRAQVSAAAPDRAAVARLYHRRTHALEAQARRLRRGVD